MPSQAGERRIVTILFADIVSSTALVAGLDPDDAMEFLDAALARVRSPIRAFGGTIARVQGDGVMAIFGAPLAYEDHAIRACLAALAISREFKSTTVRRAGEEINISVRVGINSGLIVARTLHSDVGTELDAVGWTVHAAAKAEALCRPGSVAVTQDTVDLVSGDLRTLPLGVLERDETSGSVQVLELIDASSEYDLRTHFSRRPLTPFLGRGGEFDAIVARLERARAGQGSTAGIAGEAGIGKSRLCHEVARWARGKEFNVSDLRCLSLHSTTPYAPFKAFVRSFLGVSPTASEAEVDVAVRAAGWDQVLLPAAQELLDVQPTDPNWKKLAAADRGRHLEEVIVTSIASRIGQGALLFVVEDLHLIDTEFLACIRKARRMAGTLPVLFLFTARTEGETMLTELADQVISLPPLSDEISRLLAMSLVADHNETSEPVRSSEFETLIRRPEGNPFVLEEVVRLLTSPRGQQPRDPALALPNSVEGIIQVRLDRLNDSSRRVLEAASVLGQQVELPVLAHMVNLDESALDEAINDLTAHRFLDFIETDMLSFIHEILRDACYDCIVGPLLRSIHKGAMEALEDVHGGKGPYLEQLAHHAEHAGNLPRALDFIWEACRSGVQQSAVQTVATLYRRARVMCERSGDEGQLRAVDFVLLCVDALQQQGAYAELVQGLEHAASLTRAQGLGKKEAQASCHLATAYWISGQHSRAHDLAERALSIGEAEQSLPLTVYAQFTLANVCHSLGELDHAIELHQKLVGTLTGGLERARLGAVGIQSVLSRSFLGWFLTDRGDFAEAFTHFTRAAEVADDQNQPYSQLLAHLGLGLHEWRTGDYAGAVRILSATRALCYKEKFFAMEAIVSGWYASALVGAQKPEEALSVARHSIDHGIYRQSARSCWFYIHNALAEAQFACGLVEEATESADKAISIAQAVNEPIHAAYGFYTRGEIRRQHAPDINLAAADYRQALQLARQHSMKPLQAHAHAGLARLAGTLGGDDAAQEAGLALAIYGDLNLNRFAAAMEPLARPPG